MKKLHWYYLIILVLLLISFRAYSSIYYPALNSDNAITILMVYYFKLPHDLYFWGQDRMGSLIPLIAQPFFKIFNFSAIVSESIAHYTILFFGFLAFSTFIKSLFYKIIFAIAWFFPPLRMIDITQLSFGIQYSLIGICCYLLSLADKRDNTLNVLQKNLTYFSFFVLAITAVWVSDLSIVSLFVIIGMTLYFQFFLDKNILKNKNSVLLLLYAVIGVLVGYYFIAYAKNTADVHAEYAVFSQPEIIKNTLIIFLSSIYQLVTFNANEIFTSIYLYLVLVILIVVAKYFRNIKLTPTSKKWIQIFLSELVFMFVIIIISRWTYQNNVPRRYFTCSYITLAFLLMMVIDNLHLRKKQQHLINSLLMITVLVGAFSSYYNLKYVFPKTLKPKAQFAAEFKSLGNIGIIGNYWNSYINAVEDPENIVATSIENEGDRNPDLAAAVFKQKNLYVIRDMWMEKFPDTLIQFKHTLIKDGNEFYLGDSFVCKYKLEK